MLLTMNSRGRFRAEWRSVKLDDYPPQTCLGSWTLDSNNAENPSLNFTPDDPNPAMCKELRNTWSDYSVQLDADRFRITQRRDGTTYKGGERVDANDDTSF